MADDWGTVCQIRKSLAASGKGEGRVSAVRQGFLVFVLERERAASNAGFC